MSSYSQQDLENINGLISGGLTEAMINGEMVKYRSLADLMQIKRLIESDLGTPRKSFPVSYVTSGRGL